MPASNLMMCTAPSSSLTTTSMWAFYPSHNAAKDDGRIHHQQHTNSDLWAHDVLSPHSKEVVAHPPHQHIPAFSSSEQTILRSAGGSSSSSTFDHVPLDVDKKMFRGSRPHRPPPVNQQKKIQQHLPEEQAQTQQAAPPRTITVVSPASSSVVTSAPCQDHDDEEERRMPPATLQVLETLWLDMEEDGTDE